MALAYVPFLVNKLGLAAYGMIALSFAMVQYASPITQAISATMNQGLVASRTDSQKFARIFSTAMSICLALALLISSIALAVATQLDAIINIPPDLVSQTKWLFLATALSFAISFAMIPLTGVIFANNAIYFLNLRQAVETIFRIATTVLLLSLLSSNIKYVGFGILTGAVLGSVIVYLAAVSLKRDLRFTPKLYSTSLARGMVSTGSGVILIQIGTVFLLSTDLVLVNFIYGPDTSGAYAAAAQWAIVLRGLILSVASTVTAKVMIDYHYLSQEEKINALATAIRLLVFFAALPASFVAGISPNLLSTWLGPSVAEQASVLTVLALPAAALAASLPILATLLAANQTKMVGLAYLILGGLFIPVSVCATQLFSWGGLEISIVLGIFIIGSHYIIVIPCAAVVLGRHAIRSMVTASIYALTWTAFGYGISRISAYYFDPKSYMMLILAGVSFTAIYCAIGMSVMPREDRNVIKGILRSLVGRNRQANTV